MVRVTSHRFPIGTFCDITGFVPFVRVDEAWPWNRDRAERSIAGVLRS